MKIGVVGQGYVGLTISAFAGEYFKVTGLDNNLKIVNQLNAGISHVEGVESSVLRRWIKADRFRATSNGQDIADVDLVVIAVPTPLTSDRKPDLGFIEAACKTIGENIKKPVLVINESTSFPGTLRNYIKPAIEKYSKNLIDSLYEGHINDKRKIVINEITEHVNCISFYDSIVVFEKRKRPRPFHIRKGNETIKAYIPTETKKQSLLMKIKAIFLKKVHTFEINDKGKL
jgi:UDP-N-acetyl-D-mannosaminuronate dehydrogenase